MSFIVSLGIYLLVAAALIALARWLLQQFPFDATLKQIVFGLVVLLFVVIGFIKFGVLAYLGVRLR